MNKCFIIILYVVEGSEKLFTFCMVSIFRKKFRMEWLRKFVFNFNLTGDKYWSFSPYFPIKHALSDGNGVL